MRLLLLLAAAIVFSTGGLFMKASAGLTRLGPSLAVFVTFCAGAALQAIAMRREGMAVTYVFVLGLEAVTAFLLGAAFLGERISVSKLAALCLIVGGIALLHRPV